MSDDHAVSQRRAFSHLYSVELAPSDVVNFNPDPAALLPGSRVFLTHLEGKPLHVQADAARRLIGLGYEPVPHLGARNFKTEEQFRSHVMELAAAGVRQALVVGGNPKIPAGPFSEALHLLQDRAFKNSGFDTVFIGVYPEGHPDISDVDLSNALASKIVECRRANIEPRFISQFAFDGGKLASFVQELLNRNPGIPMHLGVAGVTSLPKLIKFAMMCGVGPSLSVLRKSGASGLFNIIETKTPDDLLLSFERSYSNDLPPVNLHFFPFGGWNKTVSWLSEQGRKYVSP